MTLPATPNTANIAEKRKDKNINFLLDNTYSVLYIIYMTRTQLYLPQDQYEELKKFAALKKQTFAAFVRDLIDEKLREKKFTKKFIKQKSAFSLLFDSLPKIKKLKGGKIKDLSIHHDEYLYGKKRLT